MAAPNVIDGEYRTSFGGPDITAVFGDAVLGTLQAISYSITREKGPVYTMKGGADPISFARGKRAIAGSLVFVTIDEASLLNHFVKSQSDKGKFFADRAEVQYNYDDEALFDLSSAFSTTDNLTSPRDTKTLQKAWYTDQILPFEVNLSASNEFGKVMKKSFIGVELLNEGGGVSIDDLVIEEQYTYICRSITPWTLVTR